MTYEQVVNLILVRMGNRRDLRASAEAELVDVQENVIEKETQFRPWFLLAEDFETLPVTAALNYAELPAAFLAPAKDGFMYTLLSNGNLSNTPMRRVDYNEGIVWARTEDGDNIEANEPTRYSLVGSRIYVWPFLEADTDVYIRYYAKQATINAATAETHPILAGASDWLLNEAGSRVAEAAQHEGALKLFQARAQAARRRVEAETYEREQMDSWSVAGGDL